MINAKIQKTFCYLSTDWLRLASILTGGANSRVDRTDKNLIEAHRRGEPAAFGEIVRRHGGSVLGYLMKMTGSLQHAEDLFQETFLRVHRKAHTLRGDSIRPWIFAIATRVALQYFRRRRKLHVVSLDCESDCENSGGVWAAEAALADNSSDPSQLAAKDEQAHEVRRVINLLPVKQRAVLLLSYYEGLTYGEIARTLGCSIGTVKTHMFRALRALAKTLPDVSGESR